MTTSRMISILIISAVVLCSVATAQVPQTMVIQGQIFLPTGQPVPDGDVPVIVTLHAGATTDDVIPVCNPCTVTFKQGVFTLVLGEPNQSPLPPMDKQYWVQLSVNGEALQPRIALHSVPYAMSAPGGVPIGCIMPFAGLSTAIPDGWMLCDGSPMSSKATPKLFEACAKLWGDGSNDADESTDFNLPDLRGMFLRGADNGGRDQFAYARSHNPGPPAVTPDSSVGTYAGTVEGFEGTPVFARGGSVRPVNNAPGSIGSSSVDQGDIESTIALRTPNASVNYIIRVR